MISMNEQMKKARKKIYSSGLFLLTTFFVFSQGATDVITVSEVERIERALSADEMMGRKAFTPYIDKAADFIAAEFKKTGLASFHNSTGFRQEFVMVSPKFVSTSCTFDQTEIDIKDIVVVTCREELTISEKSGFEITKLEQGKNLITEAQKFIRSGKNLLVLVDPAYANTFARLGFLKRQLFKMDNSVVFVLAGKSPSVYVIEARHDITEQKLSNVLGVLPGKSRKDEYVIFSAHYDHIGTGKPVNGDSIFNGANDDAAGTTAVMMLAQYFKALNNNERTILFVAFTAEEIGGFGSAYFSRQLDPGKVMAMFNIEMIGTESKWGKNSAFITGYEKTDMGTILQKNLEGTGFVFHPDPYTEQNLFYRSDNATLARLGVPAHTISTAKMENEPHYHKVSDHIETLDLDNMTRIIKSIALSSRSIISGKETPSRVKTEDLR